MNRSKTFVVLHACAMCMFCGCSSISGSRSGTQSDVAVIGTIADLVADSMDTGHQVQCWQITPTYAKAGSWKLSIQHAAAGPRGAFHLTAWTDSDGDGLPDKEIGRSELMQAEFPGQWSSWEFAAAVDVLYVGNCWPQSDEMVFYQMKKASPKGYVGLGNTNYFAKDFDGTPNGRSRPRYTNIVVKYQGR